MVVSCSDFDGDVHAGGQIELLQFIHGLGGGIEDVNQPLVGALFESFLRLLVRVRGALDGEGDFTGRLVDDSEVIGLEANSNALSHTKSDCLSMVVKKSRLPNLR